MHSGCSVMLDEQICNTQHNSIDYFVEFSVSINTYEIQIHIKSSFPESMTSKIFVEDSCHD